MKKFLIILIGTLLLLPSIGNMVVYFSFKINQTEISKTLCIQKEAKFNTCNGRCVLDYRLKQLENKQEKAESVFKLLASIEYIETNNLFEFPIIKQNNFKKSVCYFYSNEKASGFISDILHPPTFFC